MSLSDEGEKETPIKVLETSDDEDEKETPINVPETSDEEEEKESPPEAEHLGLPEGASADLTVVASPSSPLPKKRTRKTVAWRQPSLQELEQAGEEEDEPPKKRRATKGRKSKKAEKTPETEVTPASEEPELQQLDLPEEDSPSISNSPASERSPPVSSSPSSPGVSSSSVPTTSRQNSLVPPATTAYPVQSPAAIELGRASAASATTNSRESSLGTVDDDGGGRPRRRAAAAAQGALKEPKLGKLPGRVLPNCNMS